MDRSEIGRKIDFTNCNKNVWLVKVPKFMSDDWENCEDNEDVGLLSINKTKTPNTSNVQPSNKGPEIMFALNPKLSKRLYHDETSSLANLNNASTIHKVLLNPIPNNTMFIYSQTSSNCTSIEPKPSIDLIPNKFKMFSDQPKDLNSLQFTIEGKISQRAEIQPLSSSKQYMKLKKAQFTLKNQPVHFVQKLDRHVQNYKPVSDHSKFTKNDLLSASALKGGVGIDNTKKIRLDKDRVMEVLFSAFEKHQYYSIKDLVKISDQPVTYLKEVLKEICNYNLKNPYRNMWELKPEYRHYSANNEKV